MLNELNKYIKYVHMIYGYSFISTLGFEPAKEDM